jgi:serine/threonine-protein kinase
MMDTVDQAVRFGADDHGMVGHLLRDRFRLLQVIDEGGAAVVYRSEDIELGRPVAVKVLQPELVAHEEARGRFEREAHALAQLSHPHIVNLLDYGVHGGAPYLVMELLEGRSLADLLEAEQSLPPERAFAITKQVLRALAFAHSRGLLHRDLKPGNVFLQSLPDTPDHVKLLDFGLAKFVAGPAPQGPPLTRAGTVSGTPPYMAPEQASARPMDERTDVYAVGVLLYEMLSSRRPFEGGSMDVMRAKLVDMPPPLAQARPDVTPDERLEALLATALAREPDARFASATAMLQALDTVPQPALQAPRPSKAKRVAGTPAPGAFFSARPLHEAAAIPRPLLRALLLMPVAFMLLAEFSVGLWMILDDDEPQAGRADRVLPSGVAADEAQNDPGSGATGSGTRAANPWDRTPLPDVLKRVHGQVQAGQDIRGETLRALKRYAREHPDDPRPHLLVGHVFTARGWRRDALPRYQQALQDDDSALGDPLLLQNLLHMATRRNSHRRASDMVRQVYGADALPALQQMLRSAQLRPAQERRLEQLQRSLEQR